MNKNHIDIAKLIINDIERENEYRKTTEIGTKEYSASLAREKHLRAEIRELEKHQLDVAVATSKVNADAKKNDVDIKLIEAQIKELQDNKTLAEKAAKHETIKFGIESGLRVVSIATQTALPILGWAWVTSFESGNTMSTSLKSMSQVFIPKKP